MVASTAVLLLEILDDLELAAVHPAANTSSKNWSGATDIFGDPTARRPRFGGLHARAASGKA
jgi:hypothetical protein